MSVLGKKFLYPRRDKMLRKVVLIGLAASTCAVPHFSQDDLNKQTGMARAAAHREAMQSENEIAKLVSSHAGEGGEMGWMSHERGPIA